ncbi:GTPase LSG1-2-like protein [Tanacetum coccineum]|uniref:GTPase LSG1-2-like protein n=1 Tax=Tanacetum coccineum TaxID=301880 RepID=A0ABQ4ZSH1_9ASTR
MNSFLEGFSELIPRELISMFNDKELELLISGLPEINCSIGRFQGIARYIKPIEVSDSQSLWISKKAANGSYLSCCGNGYFKRLMACSNYLQKSSFKNKVWFCRKVLKCAKGSSKKRLAQNAKMTVEELDDNERRAFFVWRHSLARLKENDSLVLTPFEKNLDIWRQLWRVVGFSDLVSFYMFSWVQF